MFWKHDKIGENYWMTSRPSRQVMHCNDINVQFYDKIIYPKYYKNSNQSCTLANCRLGSSIIKKFAKVRQNRPNCYNQL